MLHWLVVRVRDGSVRNFVEREAGAGVGNVAGDHVLGADVFDLDMLIGIEAATVFDGVHQHFAESSGHLVTLGGREVCDFVQELHEAVGGADFTADAEAKPLRSGRDDVDAVVPCGTIDGEPDHIGELVLVVGSREKAEGMGTHGCEDIRGRARARQNDEANVGPQAAHDAEEFNVLQGRGSLAAEDKVEASGENRGHRVFVRRDVVCGPETLVEDASQQVFEGGVCIDDEDVADWDGRHGNSAMD